MRGFWRRGMLEKGSGPMFMTFYRGATFARTRFNATSSAFPGNAMKPEDVKTVADAKKIVNERKLTHVNVGVFDIDGILRGKYMSRDKFFGSLDKGFGFSDVVLGWDSTDHLYANTEFTSWHTPYPDAQ